MNNNNCGIYLIRNKQNGLIYIGKSKDLKKRKKQFFDFKRKYGGKIINDVRKKYNDVSFWDYEILEYCIEEELNEKEIHYIDLYDSTNREIGYNITLGGDGAIGYVFTDEAKKAVSEGLKRSHHIWTDDERKAFGDAQRGENNPMWGKTLSPETKQRMSERMRGSKNPFYGKKHSQEVLNKIAEKKSKPIYQLDIETNEIINEWKSACEASRELNICRRTICRCCNKEQDIYKGFRWCFKSDYDVA